MKARRNTLAKLHRQYLLNYFGNYRHPKVKYGQILTFKNWDNE
jgi:hypothetical protein